MEYIKNIYIHEKNIICALFVSITLQYISRTDLLDFERKKLLLNLHKIISELLQIQSVHKGSLTPDSKNGIILKNEKIYKKYFEYLNPHLKLARKCENFISCYNVKKVFSIEDFVKTEDVDCCELVFNKIKSIQNDKTLAEFEKKSKIFKLLLNPISDVNFKNDVLSILSEENSRDFFRYFLGGSQASSIIATQIAKCQYDMI